MVGVGKEEEGWWWKEGPGAGRRCVSELPSLCLVFRGSLEVWDHLPAILLNSQNVSP